MRARRSTRKHKMAASGNITPLAVSVNPRGNKMAENEKLPVSYQAMTELVAQRPDLNAFNLRLETYKQIEKVTGRPLICYVAKTNNVSSAIPAYIDHSDLFGFSDLVQSIDGEEIDVFLTSNGGSAEATERIVRLI